MVYSGCIAANIAVFCIESSLPLCLEASLIVARLYTDDIMAKLHWLK